MRLFSSYTYAKRRISFNSNYTTALFKFWILLVSGHPKPYPPFPNRHRGPQTWPSQTPLSKTCTHFGVLNHQNSNKTYLLLITHTHTLLFKKRVSLTHSLWSIRSVFSLYTWRYPACFSVSYSRLTLNVVYNFLFSALPNSVRLHIIWPLPAFSFWTCLSTWICLPVF